jgi:hypothetical protein
MPQLSKTQGSLVFTVVNPSLKSASTEFFHGNEWQRVRDSNPCTGLERAVS